VQQGLGDENAVESSSANLMETDEGFAPVFFEPRGLQNLVLVDEMSSLNPLVACRVRSLLIRQYPSLGRLGGRGGSLNARRRGEARLDVVGQVPGSGLYRQVGQGGCLIKRCAARCRLASAGPRPS
jgi:splicing factor 3B subunit 3